MAIHESGAQKTGGTWEARQFTFHSDLLSGIVFLVLGLVILLLLPTQVVVAKNDVVNGRVFPWILTIVMMVCGGILVARDAVRLARGRPVQTKTLTFGAEAREGMVLGILVASYLLCVVTDLFVAGACFCAVAFLLFFGCRKKSYYAITLVAAVAIWASFRFVLNVNF